MEKTTIINLWEKGKSLFEKGDTKEVKGGESTLPIEWLQSGVSNLIDHLLDQWFSIKDISTTFSEGLDKKKHQLKILKAFKTLQVDQEIEACKLRDNGRGYIKTNLVYKFRICELIPDENKILVRNIDTDSQELFYIDTSKWYADIQWSHNDDEKWMIDV